MHTTYRPHDTMSIWITDKERMARGILVTHRDGSTGHVTKEDLDMPKWNFWRLYYQCKFGKGPPKHLQGNRSIGTFSHWIRGLHEGQENFSAQWNWRVLWSLNKTLGFGPANPHFIAPVEAEYTKRHYEKADLSDVWQMDADVYCCGHYLHLLPDGGAGQFYGGMSNSATSFPSNCCFSSCFPAVVLPIRSMSVLAG